MAVNPMEKRMSGEIVDETIRIIAEKIELDPASITPDTKLSDIDITSLDLADIVFELEDKFDIEIELNTTDAWDQLKTVSDIASEVGRLVKGER
jgi:nodulation protein F